MKPEPLIHHPQPAYPTRREFLAAGAAAVALVGVPGCGGDAAASIQVAPIFPHGDGRGATGCMVISPPVFMSEEEALQVIREEFAKIGVKLGEGMPMQDVTVEYEDPAAKAMRSYGEGWLGEPPTKVSHPGALTAVDSERKIGIDIITTDDCNRFSGRVLSSVQAYDTKGLAEITADSFRQQGKQDLRVGVFYDPMESWSFGDVDDEESGDEPEDPRAKYSRTKLRAKEKSEEQLRQQVRDFVAWLEKTKE